MLKGAKQRRKRLLSLLLTGCMTASLTPTAFAASAADFTDVPMTEWYYSSVNHVVAQGYFAGTGEKTFSPNVPMTRGMFVTVLARLDGAETNHAAAPFADVAAGAWYADAVAWAVENGLVSGVGENRFAPEQNVTRQQMAAILARYLAYYTEKHGVTLAGGNGAKAFSDAEKIDAYAKEAVALCCGYGLISGYPNGSFGPTDLSTRAQVASVILRLEKLLTSGEATPTPDQKAEEKTTEEKKDSGGGSGGGSSSSGKKSSNLTAKTAADFAAAAEAAYANVTATIADENSLTVNDDVTIDNSKVKHLTLELGKASLGDLTVHTAYAETITINGTGSVQSLCIYAPKATVTNHVTVNGSVNIQAVSGNSFDNDAQTGNIILSGPGAVNDQQETPAQIVVDTAEAVIVKGKSAEIQVVADAAQLIVATEAKVESTATDVTVTVDTDAPVEISGRVATVAANATKPSLKVEGTVEKITVPAAETVAIAGSGTIGSMETKAAAVTIAEDAKVSVERVTAADGGSVTAPANTIQTVAVTGTVTLDAAVQTVDAEADAKLTLGAAAKVQTIEAQGSLTLDGSGEVLSIDVQNEGAATIAVNEGAEVAVAQITKTATNKETITVNGLEAAVVTKAAKPKLSVLAPEAADGNGKITGVTTAMEYKGEGVTSWTDVSDTDTMSIAAGTYQVRVKATNDALASEAVTVTIPAAIGVTKAETRGTTFVGQTLTAVANADATGTLRYQWKAGEAVLEKETGKTLVLTDEMVGKSVTVTISNYDNASVTSNASAAVTVDKTALKKLIAKAAEVQQGVTANDNDKSAVPFGVRFVSTKTAAALNLAKQNAEAMAENNAALTAAVSAEESALRAAINTYEKAIQIGTYDAAEAAEALRAALGTLITDAEATKVGTTSEDAKTVAPDTVWVTEAVQDAYEAAITAAVNVKDNSSATVTELAAAITALNTAISDYIKAIQKGAVPDDSALLAAINAASLHLASVEVSVNGTDVLPSKNWITETVKSDYAAAIAAAKSVMTNTTSATTQSDYDTALRTLNTATDTFHAAKKAGTKDIVAPVVTDVSAVLNGTTVTISFTTNEAGSYQVGKEEAVSIGAAGKVSFTVTGYDKDTKPNITVTVTDGSKNATTFTVVPTSKVVEVGGKCYETLEAAIENAQDGDTIKLLKDVTGAGVVFDKSIKATLDLNGKTFKATSNGNNTNHRVIYVTTGELTIQNGTLDSRMVTGEENYASTTGNDTDFYGTVRVKDSKVTLKNLTLYNNHNWGMSVKADQNGTIFVEDCKVYSTVGGGLESAGGNITVKDSNFEQTGSNSQYAYIASGLAVSYGGTVDIYNTGFDTEGNYALYVYSSGGTINVYGGTFSGKVQSVHADTMETATADSVVNIYDGVFEGSVGTGGTSTTKQNKITISGGTFSEDPKAYLAEGYDAEKNDEGKFVVKTAAAKIGETEYATLAAAVAAVHEKTEGRMTETTITLQRDAAGGGFGIGYATIADNTTKGNDPVSIVIDLNGHTYTVGAPTVGSAGTETNGFQMLKGSKVTFRNGTIQVAKDSTARILFQNYCDFVLEDVTVDIRESGAGYAVSNNFGSFTAKGDTVIDAGDAVAFDLWYGLNKDGLYDDGVTVTFGADFTGTVTGKIEYGAENRAADMEWAKKTALTIAGGTFHTTITDSNSNDGVDAANFNISVTGGTFDHDPSAYVAAGYQATEDNGTWTVAVNSVAEEAQDLVLDETEAAAAEDAAAEDVIAEDVIAEDAIAEDVIAKNEANHAEEETAA